MNLGNFCVSLTVKNLEVSRDFYAKLGFKPGHGDGKTWLVMQNGTTKIGLFMGMFDKNMLTFNPGWDSNGQPVTPFTDVRELQKALKRAGIVPAKAADESTKGPEHFMLVDPDGNPILFDQHV
ncbi:MAG: VOC family protein [Myxococcaceae bacterium]|nr:VOC family protein [Myxococcaceae bacterium]